MLRIGRHRVLQGKSARLHGSGQIGVPPVPLVPGTVGGGQCRAQHCVDRTVRRQEGERHLQRCHRAVGVGRVTGSLVSFAQRVAEIAQYRGAVASADRGAGQDIQEDLCGLVDEGGVAGEGIVGMEHIGQAGGIYAEVGIIGLRLLDDQATHRLRLVEVVRHAETLELAEQQSAEVGEKADPASVLLRQVLERLPGESRGTTEVGRIEGHFVSRQQRHRQVLVDRDQLFALSGRVLLLRGGLLCSLLGGAYRCDEEFRASGLFEQQEGCGAEVG